MILSKGTTSVSMFGIEDLQCEIGGGQGAGDGDLDAAQIVVR